MMSGEKAYRYEERRYATVDQFGDLSYGPTRLQIILLEFDILKYTDKGAWIKYYNEKGKKFILKNSRKKFACFTKEQAIESFKARKRRQIMLLSGQLNNAKAALSLADKQQNKIEGML